MVRHLLLGVTLALTGAGHAQWFPVGAGMASGSGVRDMLWEPASQRLYAFGRIDSIDGIAINHTAYWDGYMWFSMGSGVVSPSVLCAATHNSNLVVGGYFQSSWWQQGPDFLAAWDGVTWSTVGNGVHGPVIGMSSLNGALYVCGGLDSAGGQPTSRMAYFDTLGWHAVLLNQLPAASTLSSIIEHEGSLIIAGNFDSTNGCHEIAQLNGDTLLPLGPGILGDAWVNDMVVYDGDLYVAGYFFQGAGNPATGVMKWDGTSWSDPFPGVAYTNQAKDFDVFDGKLYIAGPVRPYGDTAQYPYTVARYDGTELCLLARGNTSPMRVAANDDFLFVAPNSIDPNGYNQCPLMRFDLSFPFDTCMTIIQGLDHHPVEPAFTLFPNPSEGMLTVGSSLVQGAVSIRVQDATGRVVHVVNGTHQRTFDLDHLASGPYWVTLTSEDGTTSTLPWHKL